MRRKDREVTNLTEIKEILETCKTCHLAMADDEMPYVIPLNYGFELKENTLTLYFHSAKAGRKIDILHKNNTVCFEISHEGTSIYDEKTPCNSGYYYSSVHGFGNAVFIDDVNEKCQALSHLMKQQWNSNVSFTPEQADSVCVFKVTADQFTGKKKVLPERENKCTEKNTQDHNL